MNSKHVGVKNISKIGINFKRLDSSNSLQKDWYKKDFLFDPKRKTLISKVDPRIKLIYLSHKNINTEFQDFGEFFLPYTDSAFTLDLKPSYG